MAKEESLVKIEIDGLKPRNVISLRYGFRRREDPNDGEPESDVNVSEIYVKMKSLEDEGQTEFPEWICARFKPKKGTITFVTPKEGQQMKQLKFEDGYLMYYQESFNQVDGYYEEINISPRKVEIGTAKFEQSWGKPVG